MSPSAFDQPPEYHAQSTPRALRRSPIVGAVWGGSRVAGRAPAGTRGWIVLTAKSPHASPAGCGVSHATVSAPSRTSRVGVYSGYVAFGNPLASTSECRSAVAPGNVGVAAAISHWWLRNEPPNAAWKKWSAMT